MEKVLYCLIGYLSSYFLLKTFNWLLRPLLLRISNDLPLWGGYYIFFGTTQYCMIVIEIEFCIFYRLTPMETFLFVYMVLSS